MSALKGQDGGLNLSPLLKLLLLSVSVGYIETCFSIFEVTLEMSVNLRKPSNGRNLCHKKKNHTEKKNFKYADVFLMDLFGDVSHCQRY